MKSLAKKLVLILSEAQKVKKSGVNKFANYQYTTESDLLELIRPQLVKHGIFVFSSVDTVEVTKSTTKKGDENLITTVITKHTFVDSETGESYEVRSAGQGADQQDKGIYKAITGSTKYMLWKNFLVESNDDPENDSANASYVRGDSSKSTVPAPAISAPKSFSKPIKKVDVEPTKVETKVEAPKVEAKKEEAAPVERKTFGQRKFVKTEANF
jgi:hypothetical protein